MSKYIYIDTSHVLFYLIAFDYQEICFEDTDVNVKPMSNFM
jgi:hypothetical protein